MPFNHPTKLAVVLSFTLFGTAHAAPPDGARVFQNTCAMCHTATPNMTTLAGPGLYKVVGRKVASVPGFGYSAALKGIGAKGGTWTAKDLDLFLKNPAVYAPGTMMPMAVAKAEDRAALIAFLGGDKGKSATLPTTPAMATTASAPTGTDGKPQ